MPVRPAVRYAKARLLRQELRRGKKSPRQPCHARAERRRTARPALIALAAAGRVRAAPTRKGQSGPTAEYSTPATMGPTIRAIEPAAMLSPSMAPCRPGGDERLIRAEMLGMASDMPHAPIPMKIGRAHV